MLFVCFPSGGGGASNQNDTYLQGPAGWDRDREIDAQPRAVTKQAYSFVRSQLAPCQGKREMNLLTGALTTAWCNAQSIYSTRVDQFLSCL